MSGRKILTVNTRGHDSRFDPTETSPFLETTLAVLGTWRRTTAISAFPCLPGLSLYGSKSCTTTSGSWQESPSYHQPLDLFPSLSSSLLLLLFLLPLPFCLHFLLFLTSFLPSTCPPPRPDSRSTPASSPICIPILLFDFGVCLILFYFIFLLTNLLWGFRAPRFTTLFPSPPVSHYDAISPPKHFRSPTAQLFALVFSSLSFAVRLDYISIALPSSSWCVIAKKKSQGGFPCVAALILSLFPGDGFASRPPSGDTYA